MNLKKHRKPTPDPERVRIRLQSAEVEEADGGFVFTALAQKYNVVNDKLMMFLPGSAQKTISERVKNGRVKIHDGHPWDPNSDTIVGRVLEATETNLGVTYRGFLSGTESDLAQKIVEGVIDENSIELHSLREECMEVSLDEVPKPAKKWARITADGLAEVRGIQEWMWMAIGLVSNSSQGIRAILEVPQLVPYQDLPIAAAAGHWDPGAAEERVRLWAGTGSAGIPKVARAFLARLGADCFDLQIADVVDGELVVIPEALGAAFARLESMFDGDPVALAAAARTLGRYEQRMNASLTADTVSPDTSGEDNTEDLASDEPPETTEQPTSPVAPGADPPTGTDGDESLGHSARENALRELKLEALKLDRLPPERRENHESASAGSRAARPGSAAVRGGTT